MIFMSSDSVYMQRTFELAVQGRGWTNPNPMTGAVVVKDDQIIGEGFHPQAGQPHAENYALDVAKEGARGATLYLNLEPCAGRNNSCAGRIIEAGISRVVIATRDPNLNTSGKGIRALQDAGIEVEVGVEASAARKLNEIYFKYIVTKRPFLAIRTATSLDGKTRTTACDSQWIAGKESNEHHQGLRASFDAVMVGINVIMREDPDIVCRLPRAHNPLRIVIDSFARTPINSKLFNKPGTGLLRPNTLIVTTKAAPEDRIRGLQSVGAEVLVCPELDGGIDAHVDLARLMQILSKREITSVLLEGGSSLNAAALSLGIVDKIYQYVAPKIIGGSDVPTMVGGMGVAFIEEALTLNRMTARPLGNDLLFEAYLREED
ncbi:MAG TPA: bifunctional diaminohydroxyphosphoribosylaminopyrimidine deaminase/5-amino-6-(5-phosphoribosylamino)uracil reductase RibD [Cyanobacteria bacterium UBA8530]|nr:bifunctional diaminohydroxyphosphoribosylaminopyrimidine deaminase/5-amino-6-(5-phosphoribosylamino)uracil reductase RibD [Cyanobacteria bacterium UBA8530]